MNLLNVLTVKNLMLNKKRTIETLFSVFFSVVLITVVTTMYSSAIRSLIDSEIVEHGNYHVVLKNISRVKAEEINRNRKVDNVLTENAEDKSDESNEVNAYITFKLLELNNYDDILDSVLEEDIDKDVEIVTNERLIRLQTNPFYDSRGKELGIIAIIICGIIVCASIVYIKKRFDISVMDKLKQYELLQTLGATKRQIRKNILFESTMFSMISIPIGIIAGICVSNVLIKINNYFASTNVLSSTRFHFSISWIALGMAIAIAMFIMYVSALCSTSKVSKVSAINYIDHCINSVNYNNNNVANIRIIESKIKPLKAVTQLFGVGEKIYKKNFSPQ